MVWMPRGRVQFAAPRLTKSARHMRVRAPGAQADASRRCRPCKYNPVLAAGGALRCIHLDTGSSANPHVPDALSRVGTVAAVTGEAKESR